MKGEYLRVRDVGYDAVARGIGVIGLAIPRPISPVER